MSDIPHPMWIWVMFGWSGGKRSPMEAFEMLNDIDLFRLFGCIFLGETVVKISARWKQERAVQTAVLSAGNMKK
jgi:hypothetical protein